jgi:hypothetical protein
MKTTLMVPGLMDARAIHEDQEKMSQFMTETNLSADPDIRINFSIHIGGGL